MTSKIEWLKDPLTGKPGYSINPVKGLCPVGCSYCYARKIYRRFKWNPEIRWEPEHLLDLNLMPEGSKVFIGSTIELFGDWVKEKWLRDLFYWWIPRYPRHTFLFLTKCPQNLSFWSPFPSNCWVGTSLTGLEQDFYLRVKALQDIQATVKFISFEPLLTCIGLPNRYPTEFLFTDGISWVICGLQTPYSPKTAPRIEWMREIVEAADKVGIAVFLKNNLRLPQFSCEGGMPFYKKDQSGTMALRQEFPKVEREVVG